MHLAVRPAHILLFVCVMTAWGLNFAVAKTGLLTFPPIWMVTLRFVMVALMLIWFVPRPHGHWRQIAVVSMVLGVLHFCLMFVGLRTLDAATAAIAIQLQVPMAALLAAFTFGDRLGWRRGLGMVTAFSGVALIAGEPRLHGQYLALAMVLGAAALWSVSAILIKRMGPIDGLTLNAWLGLFSAPILAACSFALEDGQIEAITHSGFWGWFAVVYQAAVVTVFGYGTWYWLLRQYDVNQAMPFTLLIPPIGVMSGIVFLGEPLTLALIAGGLLTVSGVAIIVVRRPSLVSEGTKAP
jgi:O-acetylserine/cysteine efflux transporter